MNVRLHIPTRALAPAAVLAALALGGCGSDEESAPIPREQVAQLERNLGSMERRIERGGAACDDIFNSDSPDEPPIRQTLEQIPQDVDAEVRDALNRSFDRLFELARERCEEEAQQDTTPTEPTPAPAPTPPPPEPEPTTPTTTEEEPQGEREEKPEEPPKPRPNENGNGGGAPDQDGGGGGAGGGARPGE